jgi:hypothetical protein
MPASISLINARTFAEREVTSNAGVIVLQDMPLPGKQKLRGEISGRQADAEFQEYKDRLDQRFVAAFDGETGLPA